MASKFFRPEILPASKNRPQHELHSVQSKTLPVHKNVLAVFSKINVQLKASRTKSPRCMQSKRIGPN
jgi:hypothetical protein